MLCRRRPILIISRLGTVSPLVLLLLAGILVALIIIIGLLLTQLNGGTPPSTPPRNGGPIAEPKAPKPIDDPNRIKETLQQGKTYAVVLKAGLESQVVDQAWGFKKVVSLAYAAEMAIDRTIEKNDGKTVVELRRFLTSRNVKLLCDVESVTIDPGLPGTLILGGLESVFPGTTEALATVAPIVENLLGRVSQEEVRNKATKAVAHVDSLSGKSVRITYVDGVGVRDITPVGCTLNTEVNNFISGTAVLSDCYLWELKKAPGDRWKVDGSQLSGLIDPSLRGVPTGEIDLGATRLAATLA